MAVVFPSDVRARVSGSVVSTTAAAGWASLFMLWLGAMLRGAWSPTAWVLGGPFRWVALLSGTSAIESAHDKWAVGDNGGSVGLMQFNEANVTVVDTIEPGALALGRIAAGLRLGASDPDDTIVTDAIERAIDAGDWRWSPYWSGWYAVSDTTRACWRWPGWFSIALPYVGFGVLRVLWRKGQAGGLWEAIGEGAKSLQTTPAPWLAWRTLTLLVGLAISLAPLMSKRVRRWLAGFMRWLGVKAGPAAKALAALALRFIL